MATIDAISGFQSVLNSPDKNAIHVKIEVLYERSRPYAERLMDLAIAVAMKGKK